MSSKEIDAVKPRYRSKSKLWKSVQEIKTGGAAVLSGKDFVPTLENNAEVRNFIAYWDNLERDEFMMDSGVYRKRRFGRFQVNRDTAALTAIEGDLNFYQSEEINQLNGGKNRSFAPVSKAFSYRVLLILAWKLFSLQSLRAEL